MRGLHQDWWYKSTTTRLVTLGSVPYTIAIHELTYVMMNMNAIAPFTAIVSMIILGTALLASSVSSAMCTAALDPANDAVAVNDPTKQAAPMLDQPPLLVKEPKTSLAGAFGESTQSGIIMLKKPTN